MNSNALKTTDKNFVSIPDNEKVYGEITLSDIRNSNINTADKEILLARYGEKKVKELDANYVGEQIKTAINLTIFQSGYKIDNISELIIMVVKDIFMDFSFMTLSEIGYAFRKGLRGEFGEYMGLSVKTFYVWLKEYNETLKLEATKSLAKINKPEQKQITEQEKRQTHLNWLKSYCEDFEKYKKGEDVDIYDVGGVFYSYCMKNNICYLSEDEKKELYDKAKRKIIVNHNGQNAKNVWERKDFKEIVTSVVKGENNSSQALVVNEAKRLAVILIFDKLIANGINLNDLLAQIEKP